MGNLVVISVICCAFQVTHRLWFLLYVCTIWYLIATFDVIYNVCPDILTIKRFQIYFLCYDSDLIVLCLWYNRLIGFKNNIYEICPDVAVNFDSPIKWLPQSLYPRIFWLPKSLDTSILWLPGVLSSSKFVTLFSIFWLPLTWAQGSNILKIRGSYASKVDFCDTVTSILYFSMSVCIRYHFSRQPLIRLFWNLLLCLRIISKWVSNGCTINVFLHKVCLMESKSYESEQATKTTSDTRTKSAGSSYLLQVDVGGGEFF